jgi:dihydroorotase
MDSLEIVKPDDWHLHLRDEAALRAVLPDTVLRFARAVIMPNLRPPVVTTALALEYRSRIQAALPAGAKFLPLMTLYLTDNTAPEEIARAQESGAVFAVKYYPAGATTNSDSGVTDIARCDRVLDAMAAIGMPLLVHGEVTDASVDVFDRESVFIERTLAPLVRRFPKLKVVMEHITTREAVQFVTSCGPNVAATLTAHHLLLNRNALFQGGIRPHHYCLPVLKREIHRRSGHVRQFEVLSGHGQRSACAAYQRERLRLRRRLYRARGNRAVCRGIRNGGRSASPGRLCEPLRRRLLRAGTQRRTIALAQA